MSPGRVPLRTGSFVEGDNAERPVSRGEAFARAPARPTAADPSAVHGRIVSLLDVAIAGLDGDGRIILWNPAASALFGIPHEAALGRSATELGLAREPAPVEAAIASVLRSGRAASLEGVAVDGPDGRARHVRLRLAPLGEEAAHRGALLVATDETEERKRVEQLARQKLAVESLNAALRRQAQALVERHRELEAKNDLVAAASRAKSEFIANMSHELRTPLNSIRGFCRLLLDGRGRVSDAEKSEFLEIIDRNGGELLALIDDILELAKADAGRLPVEVELVSVPELASEIADELKPLAREKGIALRVEVDAGVRPIATDPLRLQRIIRNLAANGVKFTHEGSVVIRVRPGELGGVRVDVVDTGIGVAREDQTRIWDPFEQADASNARRYGGTGLGLSIVRRLASLLGGTVALESVPGSGSSFSLDLPAALPQTAPTLSESGKGAAGPALHETRRPIGAVLVATSDAATYRELDRALIEVELAATWEPVFEEVAGRARALAAQRRLGAVVLDLATGAAGARGALEALAADGLAARSPVLVLVHGGVEEARLIAGVSEVHACPIHARRLARRIAGLIDGSAAVVEPPTDRPGARREVPRSTPPTRSIRAPSTVLESRPPAAPARERSATGTRRRSLSERLRHVPPDALAGRQILVVEDNEDSARLAQLLLEQRGCKVVLAPDAGQALAVLQRQEPDAVIMDLMLPGLDGYEATRAIRSMPERAHVPVVAATAAVLPGDKARALEAGCDDIVAKPYDADELVARVAAAIASRRDAGVAAAPRPRGAPSGGGA